MKCSDFLARNQKPIDQMKADADLGSGEKKTASASKRVSLRAACLWGENWWQFSRTLRGVGSKKLPVPRVARSDEHG